MRRKVILSLLGVGLLLVVAAGPVIIKVTQIMALIASGKSFVPPPEAVTAAPAKEDEWESAITAVGTLVAMRQVVVTPEVGGTVRQLAFDSGQVVQRGQLLVRLDTAVEEAQLASAEADAKLAETTLERTKRLVESGSLTKAELDSAEARSAKTKAQVANLKGVIERKTVRAPFAGRLGIRSVDPGAFVDAGARLVTLQALEKMYVDFNVPQQRISQLQRGAKIRITSDGFKDRSWEGTVETIDGSVDTMTRNIRVRAIVENKDEALKPGMFVEAALLLPKTEKVLIVPSTAVFYDPSGNTVFVVNEEEKDGKKSTVVHQTPVEIGQRRGDYIAVRGAAVTKNSVDTITVASAKTEEWQPRINSVGTLVATDQVTISAELPGKVTTLGFESGDAVKRGQTLIALDTTVEHAALQSAEADAKLAKLTLDRTKNLHDSNALSQAELESSQGAYDQMVAQVSNMRGIVDRKIIRAPFAGRLGIRQVDLGAYARPGTALVTLQNLATMYVDFNVPQQVIGKLEPKQSVRITSDAFADRAWEGKIATIDAALDSTSRNIRVRAVFENKDETLRPGMLVDVALSQTSSETVVVVPVKSVLFAPYGNSIFVVEDGTVDGKPAKITRQLFVRLGDRRGDEVAVLDGIKANASVATSNLNRLRNGGTVVIADTASDAPAQVASLKAGDIVVTSGAFKLHEGSSVAITEKLRPDARLAPKPEDS